MKKIQKNNCLYASYVIFRSVNLVGSSVDYIFLILKYGNKLRSRIINRKKWLQKLFAYNIHFFVSHLHMCLLPFSIVYLLGLKLISR